MEYEMRIRFNSETDDAAKEVMNETLEEIDSLTGYQVTSTTAILYYGDGETRVP